MKNCKISAFIEKYEALVKKLKDSLCRLMSIQQEEEHFEVDEIMKKIDNEHKLDTKKKMREEEFDDEYDSE